MRLRFVTITGADDATPRESLAALAAEFPFVEWGLLVSPRTDRRSRFPSGDWLRAFERVATDGHERCSGHVCGAWASHILKGRFPPELDCPLFGRMQLNVSHMVHRVPDPETMAVCLPPGREYIVQVGRRHEAGVGLARRLAAHGVDVSVLFDASGGRGIEPTEWPKLEPALTCGFAGGFGPATLADQLARLQDHVGAGTAWIDMERLVRTDDDGSLDLERVRRCLEIAAPYAQ